MKKKTENRGLSIRQIQKRLGFTRWRVETEIERNEIQPVRTKGRARYYDCAAIERVILANIRRLLDEADARGDLGE